MAGQRTDDGTSEWLTVYQACALIGVSPATLRRWSDAGDVMAFTTPGGHRRFARTTILGLLPSDPRERPSLERLGETLDRITRLYRRRVGETCRGMTWLPDVGGDELELLRLHGRRIAGCILSLLDAPSENNQQALLLDGLAAAADYGRMNAVREVGVPATVETFLRFRTLFLDELVDVARRHALDAAGATGLVVSANKAFDQLLIALMSGYETAAGAREAR